MLRAIRELGRPLGAVAALVLLSTGLASAQVQVNKQFAPTSVALGGTSVVTVTLQNSSTISAATITSFSDDISTMSGHGQLLTSPAPATTCTGGTPTISGTQVVMNEGSIPIAPTSSTPGTCTVTFDVQGSEIGNGFNTIPAASVVTSNGSPTSDVTQTLSVQSANVTVAAAAALTVLTGDTTTVTYTITNPAAIALGSTTFAISSNATSAYTIGNYGGTCITGGATAVLPAAGGTTGTTTFSGITVPASSSCTVILDVTTPTVETVNFTLAVGAITDAQAATNPTGVSAQAKFVNGDPNVTKSFNPTTVQPGGTTVLTIKIANVLTDQALDSAAESDPLPGGMTIASIGALTGCGTATAGGVGTGTFTISSATIAANATCQIPLTLNVPAAETSGTYTNTIPAANFSATTSVSGGNITAAAAAASATLTVTAAGGGVTATKAASPTSAGINSPIKITLTYTSTGDGVFSSGSVTDTFPTTPVTMVGYVDATHEPAFSAGCTGGTTPSVTAGFATGSTSISATNMSIPGNGTCALSFYVEFPNVTGVSRADTNTAGAATFTGADGNVTTNAPAATITELPILTVTNYVASESGLTNQPLTVQATVNDSTGYSDTGGVVVIPLTTGKVQLASTSNITFTSCPAGTAVTGFGTNDESFTVTLGSPITQSCTITYTVIDEGGATGSFTPGNPTYSGAVTGGTAVSTTGQDNVTFTAPSPIIATKSFTPNQIQAGGTSTAAINLVVPQAGSLAVTEAEGVGFSDALPANMNFSATPNVLFSNCQQTGQPAPAYVISGSTITLSNISLLTTGSSETTCSVTFQVTSSVVGAPLNQIDAGAITSTAGSGAANTQVAKASLTVSAGLGIQKTFTSSTLQIGQTDYVRFLVTNTASTSNLSGGSLADDMPSGLVLASTTPGTTQAGDPNSCGGAISGTVGNPNFTLTGLAVGAYSAGVAGQCVEYVEVTTSSTAVPGSVTNSIAAGGLSIGGYTNTTSGSGSVTLTAPPNPTLSKAFALTSIGPGGATALTITVANTATGAVALSGIALTDSLPTNVIVSPAPNATTTCGGTVTATPGGSGVALSGGSVAANATCTFGASVTSAVSGIYTNTIAASAMTTTQGATNASPATANLAVATPVILSKAFAPGTMNSGGSSNLNIVIANTTAGASALTGVAVSDTLPAGVTIAATPNASSSCGGTVSAVAGGSNVSLSGGSIAAAGSCTIAVTVTGTIANTYTNTIPASSVTDDQGSSNASAATAQLTILPVSLNIAKAFAPSSIASGGTSILTITLPNTGSGAVALSGMSLTDTLPAGVTIAATPNAATTCAGGTVTATAGGVNVALSGGTVAASASCTITVSVTGTVPNTYTNTIPVLALSDTQNVSNGNTASANLTITAGAPAISKAFVPASIASGGTSVLTVTVANTATGAVALTGVALTDSLPSSVTIAATPNASTTCTSGTVTAVAGAGSVALSGASLGAAASCTFTVSVTGTIANTYTNTIPASALTDTQTVTNATPASANLTITPAALTIAKAFSPTSINASGASTLTITIPNTAPGAIALSGMALTDTLPTGVTIAPTPSAVATCGGSVAATAGGTTVGLTGGSVAANASCTISVNVTGTVANIYTNTIPANSLTDTQSVSNGNAATANLTITPAPATLSKSFAPTSITSGGTSTLTITIPNTAAGAVALTNLALSDTLPANVTNAAAPNASTTCGGAVAATPGGSSVALTGGALPASASCTITVSVTGTVANTYTNTIPASALTDTQGVTNSAAASASLTIVPGAIALSKAFSPTQIVAGGTSTLTITIPNTSAGAVALSGLALTDTLPANVTIAAPSGATNTCGGTLTATAGASSVALSGGSLAALATCAVTLHVTGTVPNTYTNTIPASALTDTQSVTNGVPATANLTIAPASLAVSKAFLPTSITAGGTSVLTITIPNTGSGSIALTSLALTDTLPTNITVAATPNASTTCGGTVTATAGASSVALAGGSLAASTSCTITVSVTGSVSNTYTNTIPASALTDTQGVSNANPATANLTITPAALPIAKAFNPTSITGGGTSVLTITIPNTAAGAIALNSLGISDTLPTGVTVAAAPGAATSCGGTVTATAGASIVSLAGGSVAANATCTVTVNVTGTVPNTYTNTIPASAVTDTQSVTNTNPATANLIITPNVIALAKAFNPATIPLNGTSVLTITIPNTASGAIALSGMALTDTLPAGVVVGATPATATTCGAGTASATAGGTTVTLAGGSLAAAGTCTITVNVTSAIANTYTNTIPASALTDAQGATNTAPATAPLTVVNATLTVVKTSTPSGSTVGPGQTIAYSIVVTNGGSTPETNAKITADTLTNAALVSGSVQVNRRGAPDGVVTSATPFGTLAAGGSATITYNAIVSTSAAAGAVVSNNATVGGDVPCTGAACSAASTPNSVQLPNLNVTKTINTQTSDVVLLGQTVTYGITVSNTGTGPAAQVVVTDPVPVGVTPVSGTVMLNGAPAPGATVVGQQVTVPIALLAAGASDNVSFQGTITSAAQSKLTNVVSVGAAGLSSLFHSNPVVAQLVPSTLQVTKTASATVATAGDRVNYTITAAPISGVGYLTTTVTDTLPAGETYAPGSSRANGRADEPKVSGRTLVWTFPTLTAPETITYATVVALGVQQNQQLINTVGVTAVAPGGGAPGRGSASASVLIAQSNFGSCYPITGRVYLDANGSGHFQDPDTGIGAVHIYLDDGESVVTDQYGRYDFPCVHPGMHALRLDERTLPAGAVPYDDRNIDSEKSTRRLVHHIYDTYIIEDINFAVKPAK